jgi:hypothetical protein
MRAPAVVRAAVLAQAVGMSADCSTLPPVAPPRCAAQQNCCGAIWLAAPREGARRGTVGETASLPANVIPPQHSGHYLPNISAPLSWKM